MSSTANTRHGSPSAVHPKQPATAEEAAAAQHPLARPATRILIAGGLTLAGWLLGAALTGGSASADEHLAGHDPGTSHHQDARHQHDRRHNALVLPESADGTDGATASATTDASVTEADPATTDSSATDPGTDPAAQSTSTTQEQSTSTTQDTPGQNDDTAVAPTGTRRPHVATAKTPTSRTQGGGLLGGLIGGVVDLVGGTLNAVTAVVGTVGHTVAGTVDTVGHTVLTPSPSDAGPGGTPVTNPIGDVLDPVFSGGGSSRDGGVTATVPTVVGGAIAPVTGVLAPVTPASGAPAAAATAPVTHTVLTHLTATPDQGGVTASDRTRNSGTHAGNGGLPGGPDLPSTPNAPVAPASSASSGHDGPGGARQPFAVPGGSATTTQLKLIGTSRDHTADGAGREAALPTTSPD